MPPQNPISAIGLSKADFVKRYWFSTLQMVTVKNADWHINKDTGLRGSQDFVFMSEGRHFMVPANGQQEFVGPIANRYLDQMSKALAQADNRLEAMADFMFVADYYNQLIVGVKDLAPEYNPNDNWQARAQAAADTLPPWMQKQQPQTAATTDQANTVPIPPWEQPPAVVETVPMAQPISSKPSQPTVPPQPAPVPQVAKGFISSNKPEPETKEFEYNGLRFKMINGVDGKRYYKNDQEIDVADYNRAASMI